MSARRDFLRRVKEVVGRKPSSVDVEVSGRIDAPDRVDIDYPVDDEEAQNWVFDVEEKFGRDYEIWVRPT